MNPTSNNAGMANLMSPGPTATTPAKTPDQDNVVSKNNLQPTEFKNIINNEVTRRNGVLPMGGRPLEDGNYSVNPIEEGLLEGFVINGKEMPETAEFAAESSTELDETEVGVLFSMLGLNMAVDASTPSSSQRSGTPELSAFSTAINSSIQDRKLMMEVASPQKIPLQQAAGTTDPRTPFLDILGYGIDPETGSPLPRPAAGVSAQDTDLQQSLLAVVTATARGGEPASASPDAFNLLTGMQSAATPARMTPTAVVAAPIDIPVGEPGWSKNLGERILWMAGKSIQTASIQINPRHLGPVDIQLNLQQDQANVSFTSPHAVVRDVLEAAIPRLREMFGDSNLQLVNVDVGQRGNEDGGAMTGQFHDQSMPQGPEHKAATNGGGSVAGEELSTPRPGVLTGRGLLDDYA